MIDGAHDFYLFINSVKNRLLFFVFSVNSQLTFQKKNILKIARVLTTIKRCATRSRSSKRRGDDRNRRCRIW